MTVRRAVMTAFVSALLAGACSRAAPDPVQLLLEELEAAVEARDADRVLARLSGAFQGQDSVTRTDAHAELRRYFAGYESIRLDLHDVSIERPDATARVRFKVAFSGQARRAFGLEGLLPPSALYRFDLEARDESGTWRVTRARWEKVE